MPSSMEVNPIVQPLKKQNEVGVPPASETKYKLPSLKQEPELCEEFVEAFTKFGMISEILL